MDTTHELAAILRDARKSALLRMRSEIYLKRSSRVMTAVVDPRSAAPAAARFPETVDYAR